MTKLHHYLLLLLSILAISSASTLLQQLNPTPPLLKAYWRLSIVSLFMIVPFIYQYKQCTHEWLYEYYHGKYTYIYLLLASLCTAAHFGFWIASLNYTTVTHSL